MLIRLTTTCIITTLPHNTTDTISIPTSSADHSIMNINTHTHEPPAASVGFLLISPAEGAEVFGSSVSENKQHLLKEIISDTLINPSTQR